MATLRYMTGGLEIQNNDRDEILDIDNTQYVLTEKFKTSLRDSMIDWGTFLEIYHDNIDYQTMFDQVNKLLDIKENENLRDIMLPVVKKIYYLPIQAHLSCMMKQFMLYEPVSIAIHGCFTTIKHHYESIVEEFFIARNNYITRNDLKTELVDWKQVLHSWNEANNNYKLESSSVILLFLNPPKNLDNRLIFDIPGKETIIDKLISDIQQFHYPGFCPKVPYQRLTGLLTFPLNSFVRAIRAINPSYKFPNYTKVEKQITEILTNKPLKPDIKGDTFKRESPPIELVQTLKKAKESKNEKILTDSTLLLVQWYVTKILELRKQLLPYGKQYEDYYIKSARIIQEINELLKTELKILQQE